LLASICEALDMRLSELLMATAPSVAVQEIVDHSGLEELLNSEHASV
jgi:hypothetical protein